jgi:putative transposase
MNSVQELYFTDKDLAIRLAEVKEDFWGDLKRETLFGVKRLLETSMEVQVQDVIGARRWEHSAGRRGFRNGSYLRTLWTSFGWIDGLKVPRMRTGTPPLRFIDKYQRRTEEINALVMKMFLAGVSTRRVKEVLAPLYGKGMISSTLVSEITKELDAKVTQYHRRPIEDKYIALIVDGIYLKAKSPIKSRRRCILAVYGIRQDGTRELIDYKLARNSESQIAWECFLTSLYNRGLKGMFLEIVVMDGNKGLANAADLVWPNVPRQRCWAHKLRNAANHLPRKLQKTCTGQAREIYDADNITQANRAFKQWARTWRGISSEAVECVEKDLEELLNFYSCPKSLWINLRTTNVIERQFREVRRRTRPMSCFTNIASVDRILFAVFNRQNEIWKDKPLKITQKS